MRDILARAKVDLLSFYRLSSVSVLARASWSKHAEEEAAALPPQRISRSIHQEPANMDHYTMLSTRTQIT